MTDPSIILGFLIIGVALVLFGLLIIGISRLAKRRLPRSIVVQYLPPSTGSIFEHGLALRADRRVLTAAIVDSAVRGRVRVLTKGERRRPVAIEVVSGASLTEEEHLFLRAFQPERMSPRQERRYLRALDDLGISVTDINDAPHVLFLRGRAAFRGHRRRHLTEFFDATRARMTADGFTRRTANSVHLVLLSLVFLASTLLGLLLILGAVMNGEWLGGFVVLVDIVAVFWVLTLAPPPLLRFTERGQELRTHLSGLRDYMRMAEQDRLRYLQSPQGALRSPAGALTPGGVALGLTPRPSVGDPVAQSQLDRFVLTERLLPYAILFAQERQWQQEFEHLGGPIDIAQNMRTLGNTFRGIVVVLQVLSIILQVVRVIGAILSLFGRH